MSEERGRRPSAPLLSRQAHDALLDAIRRGEFPDRQLPPEERLAERLGVSRTTLRAALVQLEHDGVLSRRRGIGTRILPASESRLQLELGRLVALDELVREHGHESLTEIIDVRIHVLPELSEEYGLDEKSEWHVITKLWRADGHAAALLIDHVPRTIIADLPADEELLGTIFQLFSQVGPEPITHARVELVPMIVEESVRRRLRIPRQSAQLRLWQRHYGVSGIQLATSRLDANDQFIRFELVRKI